MDKTILTVKDVQKLLGGCSWDFAVFCMEKSGALLPRKGVGSPYRAAAAAFQEWLQGGAK